MMFFRASWTGLKARLPGTVPPMFGRIALGVGLLLSFFGTFSAAVALAAGMAVAVVLGNPHAEAGGKISGRLLRLGVVFLGFGTGFGELVETGAIGALLAAAGISATMLLGGALGRRLGVDSGTSVLISAGTAVCGGSAIAAMAAVIGAAEGQIAVALGTVFLLNAAALYLLPWIGELLSLSPEAFGMWVGVAVHDLSSVVGAASLYHEGALSTAVAVKLSRTLWIVPLAVGVAAWLRSRGTDATTRIRPPYFILFFLLASLSRTFVPGIEAVAPSLVTFAKGALTAALFLIGAGLSPKLLRSVGPRPMVQGLILWVFITVVSLGATTLI